MNAERAAAIMRDNRLDALLASTLRNVFYVTGYWNEHLLTIPQFSESYAIVVRDDLSSTALVTGVAESLEVMSACPPTVRPTFFGSAARFVAPGARLDSGEQHLVASLEDRARSPNASQALIDVFQDLGLTRGAVGYEAWGVQSATLNSVRERFPGLVFVPADKVFLSIRSVKTNQELDRLKAAVDLTEDAIRVTANAARPGVTESELVRLFQGAIIAGGGRPMFTYIYFGRNGAIRGAPSDRGLERGEIIRIDVGCVLRGYCSDIARNFVVGEPDARLNKLHAALVTAQDAALQVVRPGTPVRSVFREGVEAAREGGIPQYQCNYVGHGIGLDVYEAPLMTSDNPTLLEEGMVVDVELPYFEIGSAGLQVEDTVVLTGEGAQLLSTMPRGLTILP